MSAPEKPTADELRTFIKATGGEIENITDALAEEVEFVDETAAERIRTAGAGLCKELRRIALELSVKPAN